MQTVTKINPCGFCKGVINAIHIINDALADNNLPRPFYMYGGLVHNQYIINAYIEKGIIIVSSIDNIKKGTVIITAHGADEKLKDIIKAKGLALIDTTCSEVKKIHEAISQKISQGYDIIYYGKKNHPESIGVLTLSNKVHLLENDDDLLKLNLTNDKLFFTSQTTMSYFDMLKIKVAVQNKYPHVLIGDEICSATKVRQQAIIEASKENDLIIIVGDKMSNNTVKLKEVCISETKKMCILIDNASDLINYNLDDYQKIAVSAGASTPKVIIDEVILALKTKKYISSFTNFDCIK